ncbi:carboxypeptidase-like regulatory domain-containing protein [uncultured Proteiniphilum sp.]|uniref:carboxypeptidase-like regulatory domain-containing protein n=1 Tax=uncultured Proteiniphilum sp. TaxID=497637 RepID=UPI00262A324E|nr:carboxypeptidase-like regulatory domain-containing protein [uncultured Proteiniphilum sp.]
MNLKDYIRGQRQGKEANRLERRAIDDPFLQDAIDGYDSVEGDHISVIEDLEKRLSLPKKRIHKRMWIWAAAAVIILLISTPLLLYKPYTKEEIPVVSSDIIQQEKEITTPLLQKDTVLTADHFESKKEEDKPPRAKQTISPPLSVEASPETIELVAENIEVSEEIESVSDKEVRLSTAQHKTEKTLIKEPQNNVTQAVSGHAAGIVVSEEKQGTKIRIRGRSSSVAQPDKIFVSGRIVDETGDPIPGVTISLADTQTRTISDTAGNFQLTVPKDEQGTLIASFIGMKSSKIPLKENVGDIKMKADDMALNEVVVVAFGKQKKESVVGAVSVVKDIAITDSVSGVKDIAAFGEKEFRNYFTENYDKDSCAGQKIAFIVEFFIDPMGRPGNIEIKENSCPALEIEIKRLLLGSPPWSEVNRKVILPFEL